MSWTSPDTLKVRLSTTWTKCLEMLANSSFFSLTTSTVLGGKVAKRNAEDSDKVVKSWELVLSILVEEEGVEQDGELKLLPIFLSLPLVLQLRFMIFLQNNISQVSSNSIHSFLEKIDNSENNVWMTEAVRQLKNTAVRNAAETDRHTGQTVTKYAFTSESQNALHDVLNKLRNEKRWFWQKCPVPSNLETEKEEPNTIGSMLISNDIKDISVKSKSFSSALNPATRNTTSPSQYQESEITMDIIIIDEDSIECAITVKDNSAKIDNNTDNENRSDSNRLDKDREFDVEMVDINCDRESDKPDYRNSKQILKCGSSTETAASVATDQYLSIDSNIQDFIPTNFKLGRKRKLTELLTKSGDPIRCLETEKLEFMGKINEVEITDLVAEVKSTAPVEPLLQPDKDSVLNVSATVMLHLDSIREACSSNENTLVISKEIMNCFLEMDAEETKVACAYMDLSQFSEKALVNFCDSMPWTSLGNESSVMLLDGCFSSKIQSLKSQTSRTLLMSLDSVSRIQPKALIDVLAHNLQLTQSGEFQCQVLTTVCKDFLPPDCLGYLVKQLSTEGLVMNEHLVSVLQTVLDKNADLDTDSLSSFHSLLSTGSQELSSSTKFGKLLMGVLTKYFKKMSHQQRITICTLVESHSSSFRKPLLALVKRHT